STATAPGRSSPATAAAAGPAGSAASFTGRCSSWPRRLATGARLRAGSGRPPGRPRCEQTITAAPRASSAFTVGKAARILPSSVIRTPSMGTFRSARTSTRWPRTARSSMLRMDATVGRATPARQGRQSRSAGTLGPQALRGISRRTTRLPSGLLPAVSGYAVTGLHGLHGQQLHRGAGAGHDVQGGEPGAGLARREDLQPVYGNRLAGGGRVVHRVGNPHLGVRGGARRQRDQPPRVGA